MIEAQGIFVSKTRTLKWLCPLCAEVETRGSAFPVRQGATLKTRISCTDGKREILVHAERVI